MTWKAANVANIERTVSQAGKPEYVDVADAASADKAGKVVTISGVSNSKKLTFSLGTGYLTITLPSTYTANSASTSNGATISGDPGAVAEYNFSISIDVPANSSTTAKTRQIIVTDEGGHQDVCLLTSAAGDAYVTVAEGVIEVEHEGTEADPIPYAVPMEIFAGKYYTEDNQLYLCTRDSGTALSHPLSTLVGLYVELKN